jgi:DNA-binding MarR family transcriptional regulator
MTVLVDQLIQDGHVQLTPDTGNRRVISIAITAEGKRHFKQAASRYKENVKIIFSDLDRGILKTCIGRWKNSQTSYPGSGK